MSNKKPLGPPNYHGPRGQIDAETLAIVKRLEEIRQSLKHTAPAAERGA